MSVFLILIMVLVLFPVLFLDLFLVLFLVLLLVMFLVFFWFRCYSLFPDLTGSRFAQLFLFYLSFFPLPSDIASHMYVCFALLSNTNHTFNPYILPFSPSFHSFRLIVPSVSFILFFRLLNCTVYPILD